MIENAIGGSGDDIIKGNSAANRLEGRAGSDSLDGLAGADIMIGGQGDDSYRVDTVEHWDPVTQTYLLGNDQVIENPNEGDDAVAAYVSYALPDNVEELQLLGGGLNGYGNGLDNFLYGTVGAEHLEGFAGNDVLFGDRGADVMIGGQGDDTYWVDTVEHWDPVTQTYFLGNDQVIENAGEGSDLVISTVTYTLPNNVERLTLDGFGSLDGTGNNLDNELNGNLAANRLEGLAGNDRLDGWDWRRHDGGRYRRRYLCRGQCRRPGHRGERARHGPRGELHLFHARGECRKADAHRLRQHQRHRQQPRQHDHRKQRCQYPQGRRRE